jgi:uncharacterized protein (DUF952 family)
VSAEPILHIASRSAWEAARTSGTYRAESLDSEGFIHFSRLSQLARTVERYYGGVGGLVVLVVDPERLDDLREELSPSTGETFAHLYSELPVAAVTEVLPLEQALERAAAR